MPFSNHNQNSDDFSQNHLQMNHPSDPSFGVNDASNPPASEVKDDFRYMSLDENDDLNNPSTGANDDIGSFTFCENDEFSYDLEIRALESQKTRQMLSHTMDRRMLFIIKTIPFAILSLFILIFLGFVLFILSDIFGSSFIHISNNEEFDRVAQHLGFEVTHPEVPDAKRSVATFKGCTVTFEDSKDNFVATKTYFDLGGKNFSGKREDSISKISSSSINKDGDVEAMYTKLGTTVLAAKLSTDNTCKPQVDKLFKLIGYDSLHWDHPIQDEIGRRFSMLMHGL